jgi:hypothetical protein
MEEKPRKVIQLVEKHESQEDLGFKREMKEMVGRLLSILDNAGFKTLIVLEKPGKGFSMATNGISYAGVLTPIADLFDKYPRLCMRVLEKTAAMRVIQSQKDKNNTLPPETKIHQIKDYKAKRRSYYQPFNSL